MIRLLEEYDGKDLRESHYSRVIRAHLAAYGTRYDFCRFYEIAYRRRAGVIAVFNGACCAELCEGSDFGSKARREIYEFADFLRPVSIELPEKMIPRPGFPGYLRFERTFFEVPPAETSQGLISPDPETAFRTAFYGGADYGVWLTDTMHRINMSASMLLGYESSVLTVRFMSEGMAYITDVATRYEDRGKGYARTLLGRASRLLADSGYSAYLAAAPDTASFYRYLGYSEMSSDAVFNLRESEE